ncbi:MAG: copper amine oxidase N-terminal domain-containing protein, partial [Peptococcaceae bacterium]|nr:copper amine oxidase N-terminal domain-containing protein [Peptococcaceae bacterium]
AAQGIGLTESNIIWDSTSRRIILVNEDINLQLTIGSNLMLVNNVPVNMDVPPEIRNNRTFLPIRPVAQVFGLQIEWDGAKNAVYLEFPGEGKNQISREAISLSAVPPLQYSDEIQVESREFEWQYNKKEYSWQIEVPNYILDYDRDVKNLLTDFYSRDGRGQASLMESMDSVVKELILSSSTKYNSNTTPWVTEAENYRYAGYLADALGKTAQANSFDYFHTAEFVQSFVGGAIPYLLTDGPALPGQTIIDSGDCEDKSILLGAILENMGYDTALILFPPATSTGEGHMGVGICFSDSQLPDNLNNAVYYTYQGDKYYFAETTTPNWQLGQISDDRLEDDAYVFPIN